MLVTKIGNLVLPTPRSYVDEIKESKNEDFSIANREKDLGDLLRRIAYSRYPNFAILGDPGIGKTMAIDHIINLIIGKTEVKDDHEWKPIIDKVRERAKEYQKRDFIFLPNLQNPFEPCVIDYLDNKVYEAEVQADMFCKEVVNFFQQTAQRAEVYPTFTKKEFTDYMKNSIDIIYEDLHSSIIPNTTHPAVFSVKVNPNLEKYQFSFNFLGTGVPYSEIKYELGIRGKKTHKQIRDALKRRLRHGLNRSVVKLFREMKEIKVNKLGEEEKKKIVYGLINNACEDNKKLSDIFKKNEFEYYSTLQKKEADRLMLLKISDKSLDWCVSQLEKIKARYKADPKMESWMNSIVTYFDSDKSMLGSLILEHYSRVRERYSQRGKGRKGRKGGADITYALFFPSERDSLKSLRFAMKHGKHRFHLDEILIPETYTQSSESGELCIRHPRDITKKSLLGEITKGEVEEKDEDSYGEGTITVFIPPHQRFKPGYLVDSSVLIMPDNLQAFFRALIGTETKEAEARRQIILTYFQSGDLVYQENGVTFKLHCPTLVIGSDNDYPFLKKSLQKDNEYEPDDAMASRFIIAGWDSYAPNTKETRKGTIDVICDSLSSFNKENSASLKISPEVIDWFLVSTITGDSLSLKYRDLDKDVRSVLEYAESNDTNDIDLSTIKKFNKNNDPRNRFTYINQRYEGMIELPALKQKGSINGLAVVGSSEKTDFLPIRSRIIPDKDKENQPNLQVYDINAEMTGPITIKGYEEAVGFLKGQVDEPIRFTLNTSFHRNLSTVMGNSASLAIALSLWTAITGEEIYQDRVFTGTLSFFDGNVGPIGSVYDKGLSVWKWNELARRDNKPMQYSFIYPAENHRELVQSIATSPFPLEEITMVPVINFEQGLYLATREEITPDIISSLPEESGKYFQESRSQLIDKVREMNKKVLGAYNS